MDECARRACGPGTMGDQVTPLLLQTELEGFYRGDPPPMAGVSLLRLLSALDALLALSVVSSGVRSSQLQLLWKFVSVEQALSTNHSPSSDADIIHMFTPDKDPNEMLEYMRTFRSATRQFKVPPLAALEHSRLGPLQWWFAAGKLLTILSPISNVTQLLADSIPSDGAMHRQDIYDGVLQLFAERRSRTIVPSVQPDPTRVIQNTWNFDIVADSTAETDAYVELSVERNSSPGMAPSAGSAAVTARRRFVSPWLPPYEFQGEITWRIEDLNRLVEDLLNWPLGQSVPHALIWEHPAMHGCLVDAAGCAVQFQVGYGYDYIIGHPSTKVIHQVRCSVCERLNRHCYWRGAKACLSCFWEKASQGSCTGAVPPDLRPAQHGEYKPQLARRVEFLQRLEGRA
ncbi:unnamed protein product [Peniophora sp. CBMAI 1063]|nr:unnamed protein product [Peniophora sp. CBMAI 1063]